MTIFNNLLSRELLNSQNKIFSNEKVRNSFKLFQKNEISMTSSELYDFNILKWFYKFEDSFHYLESEKIITRHFLFSNINLCNNYSNYVLELRNHVINIASFHDLLFHLLDSIYETNIKNEKLNWENLDANIDNKKVKTIMNNIFLLMKSDIDYRNNVLHDLDYLWVDNYLSIEVNQLCKMFELKDEKMKIFLNPLKKKLIKELNRKTKIIREENIEKIKNIKNETNKLFYALYESYVQIKKDKR